MSRGQTPKTSGCSPKNQRYCSYLPPCWEQFCSSSSRRHIFTLVRYWLHLVAQFVGLWEAWFLLFNCQLVDELLPLVYVKPSSPGGKCCLSNKAGLAQIWCFDYCRAMKRFQGIAFQAEEDFRCNLQMSSKHQICARPGLRVIYYLEKSKCFQTHITNCCTAHFRQDLSPTYDTYDSLAALRY